MLGQSLHKSSCIEFSQHFICYLGDSFQFSKTVVLFLLLGLKCPYRNTLERNALFCLGVPDVWNPPQSGTQAGRRGLDAAAEGCFITLHQSSTKQGKSKKLDQAIKPQSLFQ